MRYFCVTVICGILLQLFAVFCYSVLRNFITVICECSAYTRVKCKIKIMTIRV